MNITLSIDEEIVKKVRKMAIDKNTTLTALVRDHLVSIANSDIVERKERVEKLKRSFQKLSRDMGPRNWSREDLYDR